jgi:putative ABC transport system permease protein
MVRVAWRMLRQRPASALATFVALWFGIAVVTACGVMLESGLRYHGTPARYAGSTLLIAGPSLRVVHGHGEDREADNSALPARSRVDAGLAVRAAALPGVRAAVADSATPVQVRFGSLLGRLCPGRARWSGAGGRLCPGRARWSAP